MCKTVVVFFLFLVSCLTLVCAGLYALNGATVYAIFNDRLSALELAITLDMGDGGWANDVTLSYIHERSLFISRFHLYKHTNVSMETP